MVYILVFYVMYCLMMAYRKGQNIAVIIYIIKILLFSMGENRFLEMQWHNRTSFTKTKTDVKF
jgi:uncharacterized membrane protein YidH (DUF202 family)